MSERLSDERIEYLGSMDDVLLDEAIAEITALKAENQRLREALEKKAPTTWHEMLWHDADIREQTLTAENQRLREARGQPIMTKQLAEIRELNIRHDPNGIGESYVSVDTNQWEIIWRTIDNLNAEVAELTEWKIDAMDVAVKSGITIGKLTNKISQLRAALEGMANMPNHDQDDEHRLRHLAKEALKNDPASEMRIGRTLMATKCVNPAPDKKTACGLDHGHDGPCRQYYKPYADYLYWQNGQYCGGPEFNPEQDTAEYQEPMTPERAMAIAERNIMG